MGQYIAAVLVPSDCPNDVPKLLEKLRRGERISHYKTKRITKDGKVLEVSLTLSPIKDSQDNIVGVSNVGRGVSQRKQVEKERAQALAVQRAANKELERINKVRRISSRL